MRFLAQLTNVNLLIKIVQTVSRMGKSCVIHLAPKKLELIQTSDIVHGVQVWAGVNAETLFDEYRIESKNNNEIAFEIQLENLLKALQSAQLAQAVVVKLTKVGQVPYLRMSIDMQISKKLASVQQDLPIGLLSASALAQFKEPHLPDPEVYIMMPPLRQLRHVVDHMKNMHDSVTITANMGGELTLKIETDMLSVATFFAQLQHPTIEGRTPPSFDKATVAEAQVDIKKFAKFLYSYQINPTNVILCTPTRAGLGKTVLAYNSNHPPLFDAQDLYLTYYLPVILVS